jgi:hypothetical protein
MNADTLDDAVARSAIQDVLDELGAGLTADSVAQRLRDAGIKGRRNRAEDCPVARYLQQRTGHQGLCVSQSGVHTSVACTTCPPENECMQFSSALPGTTMPAPVGEFIQRFDRGGFPDLVDTAA